MIKNRTLEFKYKYSNSESKPSSKRNDTPDYTKTKFSNTGFTDISEATTLNFKPLKKIAKVESSSFIKSRTRQNDFSQKIQTTSKKIIQNQTSLCRYLNDEHLNIDNFISKKFKARPEQFNPSAKISTQISQTPKEQPNKKTIFIKELPDVTAFFNNLTPRSLFFCCRCFRYVFAIEKNLHYPNCQKQVNLLEIKPKDKEKIAWEKLSMILELSEYTSQKSAQIRRFFEQAKKGEIKEYSHVEISPNVSYLGFQHISEAFVFTFEMLLKGGNFDSSGIFSMKKIFSCVEPRTFSSNLFERKFFQ